ncbi:MAG: phosphoenolpyruvate--protein phosphotransferase [Gemmatimonadota bacterium]
MSKIVRGIAAAGGRAMGRARFVEWDIPRVEHRTISPSDVDAEMARFREARSRAVQEMHWLREAAAGRIGVIEAKVFESQALMIDDPDLVEGTEAYISANYLSAERAFDWQLIELRIRMLDTGHALVMDRLADLRDVRLRVLSQLLGRELPSLTSSADSDPEIVLTDELPPSLAVSLDPRDVAGFVTAGGSRGSHSVLLARAMGIPAIVGLGESIVEIGEGQLLLMDGGTGVITAEPDERELELHRTAVLQREERRVRLSAHAGEPVITRDGQRVVMLANLDQPDDAEAAKRLGAEGIGLLRTEFLVIGRRTIPDVEDQFSAYQQVVEAFPDAEISLRTFDIGGDKFPLFLSMPSEENPYLGWRAIRVCLEHPELFRNQLTAALRAGVGSQLRIMLPFVINLDEILRTREQLNELAQEAGIEQVPQLGIMIETPAALDTLDLLAPHIEFVSLGTNDLTQYSLAVDRGNAHLAALYDPMHPALIRGYTRLVRTAAEFGLDLGVCGELAAAPLGACLLVGLGYRKLSVSVTALPEISDLLRHVSADALAEVCGALRDVTSGQEARARLEEYLVTSNPAYSTSPVGLSK